MDYITLIWSYLPAWLWVILFTIFLLAIVGIYDLLQRKNPILHNFPVIGHLRYLGIQLGPELRQYIVANNREEQPFNRREREWIETSSKGENNYFGFGTDDFIYGTGYPIISHAIFPYGERSFAESIKEHNFDIPSAKVIGESHNRKNPYRPRSIINISAMSFGALSSKAISALNIGAKLAHCYHNTGEGGFSPYHKLGAEVIMQIGTGYFGCRAINGKFDINKLVSIVENYPQVKAFEIKLSQGAKPGKGGVLPGKKVTKEIAEIRGVRSGVDCISPNSHNAFTNLKELIELIELVAKETGLPVGIKSAIGKKDFWIELANEMKATGKGPDYIVVDGGEGGTGAAPLTFADHVSLPFKHGFARVYTAFQEAEMTEKVVFIGSAKLGFPDRAITAFSMGVDLINIAREAMMAIGCIQSQKCHTDNCPAGVATQKKRLSTGFHSQLFGEKLARYLQSFRKEVLALTHAAGYWHPSQFTSEDVEIHTAIGEFEAISKVHGYKKDTINIPYDIYKNLR